MAQKKQREFYTTPIGTAVYPHLHAPDTAYQAEGVYSTKLRFTGKDAEAVQKFLDEQYELSQEQAAQELVDTGKVKALKAAQAKVKAGPEPYVSEIDEDTGEETGAILANFKMKASGTRKDGTTWSSRPTFFDASGKEVPLGLRIGSGSELRISCEINRYFTPALGAGVSLRLKAVQIISLQTWGGGVSAAQAGFDVVEGGFSADEVGEDAFSNPTPKIREDADDADEYTSDEDGDF